MSQNARKDVSIQHKDLNQYNYEEVYIHVDLVQYPKLALCGHQERHCPDLSEIMCKKSYGYILNMVTVFISTDVSPAGVVADGRLANGKSRRVVKDV